jgi:hypothetical protein
MTQNGGLVYEYPIFWLRFQQSAGHWFNLFNERYLFFDAYFAKYLVYTV